MPALVLIILYVQRQFSFSLRRAFREELSARLYQSKTQGGCEESRAMSSSIEPIFLESKGGKGMRASSESLCGATQDKVAPCHVVPVDAKSHGHSRGEITGHLLRRKVSLPLLYRKSERLAVLQDEDGRESIVV